MVKLQIIASPARLTLSDLYNMMISPRRLTKQDLFSQLEAATTLACLRTEG
jgi:hypothetical protein